MQRSGAERAFGRERTPPSTTPDRWLQRPIGDCCARLCFSGCSPVMLAPIRCASARKAALARTQRGAGQAAALAGTAKKPPANERYHPLTTIRIVWIAYDRDIYL